MVEMALNEIDYLRKVNELMSARLEMFDKMYLLFTTYPAFEKSGGMHPDVAYELRKSIAAEEDKEKQRIQ